MNQEKIGNLIQKCRKEKGLTQRELAEILGVSNRAVSKWENGSSMPDLSLMKPLCNELGITINELFDGEISGNKEDDHNIINTISLANKEHTTDIIGYLVYKILSIILIIFGYGFINVNSVFPVLSIVIGIIFLIFSSLKLIKNFKNVVKVLILTFYLIMSFILLSIINYNYVMNNDLKPKLYLYHSKNGNYEYYDTLFMRYHYCNINDKETFLDFNLHFDINHRKYIEKNYKC